MLSTPEAFEAASGPYVIGASVIALTLVEKVAADARSPELLHAVDFARKSVHVADGKRRAAFARLQALTGVATEPDAGTFDAWLKATRATIARLVAGEAARAAELGAIVGELYLATWTARTLIYLRTADPANPVTKRQAEIIDQRVGQLRVTLVSTLSRVELPAIADLGNQLTALVSVARSVADATTVENYKAYFEWASQIWNLVDKFGVMLAAR